VKIRDVISDIIIATDVTDRSQGCQMV